MYLGERRVGSLLDGARGAAFQFEPVYLRPPDGVRPVLGQWFEDRLTGRRALTKGDLVPWFSNLLPEHQGQLRAQICRRLGLADSDDWSLLVHLGQHLPGAVRVQPAERAPNVLDAEPESDEVLPPSLRSSLGGIQLKYTLSGAPDRLAIPMRAGDERWIVKIAGPGYPLLAENEAAVMLWCLAAGFDVPRVEVVPREALPAELGELPDTPTALLVERYDRVAERRIHQEDFAQVICVAPDRKYDAAAFHGVADAVVRILGDSGGEEFVRRLVATIATGNADAHLKNWSLLYPDGVTARWTPLYDQVATVAYATVARQPALRLGSARNFTQVGVEELTWVAGHAGVDALRARLLIEETITRFVRAFPDARSMLPRAHADALVQHWRNTPVLQGRLD